MTGAVSIPTLGIGAGLECDGQVQIVSDLLHLIPGRIPKHAKSYVDVSEIVRAGVERFVADVQSGAFPTEAQMFSLPKGVDEAELLASFENEQRN